MKKQRFWKRVALIAAAIGTASLSHAQVWSPTPGKNIHENHADFQAWLHSQPNPNTLKGWKFYARNFWFETARTPDNGDTDAAARAAQAHLLQSLNPQTRRMDDGGAWDNLGFPTPLSDKFAGRINCFAFDPLDPQNMFLGSPGGGLWHSNSGGQTWDPITDELSTIGVSAIAVHPTNPDIVYIGTGDADSEGGSVSDSRSVGILKTTDQGVTWSMTGMNWAVQNPAKVSRILIDRLQPNTLIAATGLGLQKTTDAGLSWTINQAGNFRDLYQDPTTPTTWLAASTTHIFRSANNGDTWTQVGLGLPSTNSGRIAIATSAANTNMVYALVANPEGNYAGFYRSVDGGLNFTLRSSPPNLLIGQGLYNLVLQVSPLDADKVYAGGVILNKSTDGGLNWTLDINDNFVDHHALHVDGAGTIWAGADQGLYKSTDDGLTWEHRNLYLDIFQHYRLGVGQGTHDTVTTGTQDNGGHFYAGGNWRVGAPGDGTGAAVDQVNPNIAYVASYNKIARTIDGGAFWAPYINSSIPSESHHFVFPVVTDPVTMGTVYCAYVNLYKSTDMGTTWNRISNFNNLAPSNAAIAIAVAPSSSSHIYLVRADEVLKTTDGGTTWINISAGLDNGAYRFTDVWVHHTNPNIAWVSVSGYDSNHKVYRTNNGGTTWLNISAGLPNISANTGIHAPGTAGDFFLGMDDGVYHFDNTNNRWTGYSYLLPRSIVTDLAINYSRNLLYASTYGRNCWTSPLGLVSRDPESPTPQPSLAAYPNPSQGAWTIRYDLARAPRGKLSIYSLDGRRLTDQPISTQRGTFSSADLTLPSGMYIVHLSTQHGSGSTRLVIE